MQTVVLDVHWTIADINERDDGQLETLIVPHSPVKVRELQIHNWQFSRKFPH